MKDLLFAAVTLMFLASCSKSNPVTPTQPKSTYYADITFKGKTYHVTDQAHATIRGTGTNAQADLSIGNITTIAVAVHIRKPGETTGEYTTDAVGVLTDYQTSTDYSIEQAGSSITVTSITSNEAVGSIKLKVTDGATNQLLDVTGTFKVLKN